MRGFRNVFRNLPKFQIKCHRYLETLIKENIQIILNTYKWCLENPKKQKNKKNYGTNKNI